MKRTVFDKLLPLCLALLVLTACGGDAPGDPGAGGASRTEVDYNQYSGAPGTFVYTDSAYLTFSNQQIRFLEPSLTAPLSPLCARAECGHSDESCPAHLEGYGLSAYGGSLYYIDNPTHGVLRLCRMGLTGEDRTVLYTMQVDSPGYTYGIDAGCGYFTLNLFAWELAGPVNTLYLFSLADSRPEPVVLYTNRDCFDGDPSGEAEGSQSVFTFGALPGIPQVDVTFPRDGWIFYSLLLDGAYQLYGYETGTGETSLVLEDWGFSSVMSPRDGLLYWYTPEDGLCSTDLASGETRRYLVPPGAEAAYHWHYDDLYFYLFSKADAGLAVYTYEGDLVQFIPFGGLDLLPVYALSTPDYILFCDSGDYVNCDYACYVEKAALAAGTAEFIPLA